VDNAFEQGLAVFPRDARGVRSVDPNNTAAVHQSITSILGQIPNEALRANWPAIQSRLTEQFGTQALDNWLNTSNVLGNTFSGQGQAQQRQIQRMLRLAGMQQTPIGPGSTGASPMQRILSLTNPGLLSQYFGR
jgi:hypothetical protein